METKVCTRCKTEKSIDEFSWKDKKNGKKKSHCKPCIKERDKDYVKQYYQDNQEKFRKYSKKWYENNREYALEFNRKYHKSDNGKKSTYKRRLKRLSYKCKVEFSPHERMEILNRDNWTCQMCGTWVHDVRKHNGDMTSDERRHKAHIDHITPISKGGDSKPENLQALCMPCNCKKNDKLIS